MTDADGERPTAAQVQTVRTACDLQQGPKPWPFGVGNCPYPACSCHGQFEEFCAVEFKKRLAMALRELGGE